MTEVLSRANLKALLPKFLRQFLRACLYYAQRVGRWSIILWQVRGVNWRDQWTIISSALASPYLALHNLLEWQDPILLDDAAVNVLGVGKFVLRKRTDDLWHVLPWREAVIFREISSCLRSGDIFIDAGANIGVYTVLASKLVGDSGRVICVEMMPDTADQLEHHIHLNSLQNVTVVRNALGDTDGGTVIASVEVGKYGKARISNEDRSDESIVRTGVVLTTLDIISSEYSSVRLMKMDIEGAELAALVGGRNLLARLEFLIYESWGIVKNECDPVDTLLINAGFTLNLLDGNNWLARKVDGSNLPHNPLPG